MPDAKTAPVSGTPLALRYLESYLDGKPNRKKATKALLGCSERTAGRIVSRRRPYRAPMKMAWVERLCNATGQPIGDILGTRQARSWQQCLTGWNHAHNSREALQFATDCAVAVAARAFARYRLSGSFSVAYSGGYPHEVVLYLSAAPDVSVLGGRFAAHQLAITAEKVYNEPGGRRRMMLQHLRPDGAAPDKSFLTPQLLESTLARIHALTKNLNAELQRETARSAA
jgi:hypothetical protein